MKMNFKNIGLLVVLLMACVSMLTACHTVKGAATGAGQDVQALSNTMNPPPPPTHKKHHKKMMQQNTTTSSGQNTSSQPSQTKSNETNTSY